MIQHCDMDSRLIIIIVILLLVAFGVIIYTTYDNIEYRQTVDDTLGNTTTHVKDIDGDVGILSSNIYLMSSNIYNVTKDINVVTSNMYKVTGEMRAVDMNIDRIRKNVAEQDRIIMENTQTVNDMTNNMAATIESVESMKRSNFGINDVTNYMSNLDGNLKNYFNFSDNQEALNNDRLFEHRLSGIQPELDIISRVTATGGMIVKTPEEISHDKNMKICNEQNNCIQLNVNSYGFNITPDNLNKMTINAKDNQPMALFDMENKSIYLGGDDNNSPLFIEKGQLYVSKLNVKENGLWSEFGNPQKADPRQSEHQPPQKVVVPLPEKKDIFGTYTFVSTLKNVDNYGDSYVNENAEFIQSFMVNVVSKRDINEGDSIYIAIPIENIGKFTGINGKFIYPTDDNFSSSNSELISQTNKFDYNIRQYISNNKDDFTSLELFNVNFTVDHYVMQIEFTKHIQAGQKISIEYIGINVFDTPHTKNVELFDGIPIVVDYADENHVSVRYNFASHFLENTSKGFLQVFNIMVYPNYDIDIGSSVVLKIPTKHIGYFVGKNSKKEFGEMTPETMMDTLKQFLENHEYFVYLEQSSEVKNTIKGMTIIGVNDKNETFISSYKDDSRYTGQNSTEISRNHIYIEINFNEIVQVDNPFGISLIGLNIFDPSDARVMSDINYFATGNVVT